MRSRSNALRAALVVWAAFLASQPFWRPLTNVAAQSSDKVVRPLFDLRSPERSPFPSDAFTVADANQNTGRRVNLPTPQDCVTHASDCEDVAILNQLDGFNMQPRISLPFDGAINPSSATSHTIFLVRLRDELTKRSGERQVVGINYIVWDPTANELSFRPDNSLDQHTSYALVVTTGVRDVTGNPIGVVDQATTSSTLASPEYRRVFDEAASTAKKLGAVAGGLQIAALSVFTTRSFSHVFERMRDVIKKAPAPQLNFKVGPNATPAIFDVTTLQSITVNAHVNVKGPLTAQPAPNAIKNLQLMPNSVGRLAFGNMPALDFTVRPSGHLPMIASRTGALPPPRPMEVAFNLWLPAATQPATGWPVVMCGTPANANKNACSPLVSVFASQGLAVISWNNMGHGYGPLTTTTVTRTDGSSVEVATPGSGHDADGNGTIAVYEPQYASAPYTLHRSTGPALQGATSLLQLVRAIQSGVDIDGDGRHELDRARIYFVGQSNSAMYGMFAFAYEPAIRAAAFSAPPGTLTEMWRLSPPARPGFGSALAARTPSLINEQGLTSIGGVPVAGPHFNENLPLRNQPPLVNAVAQARSIQRQIDRFTWVGQIVSSVAIAPFIRRSPPVGGVARPSIFQFARRDSSAPIPSSMEIVRAGDLAGSTYLYRDDRNAGDPGVVNYPHVYLGTVNAATNLASVAFGAQRQIATFFATDGKTVMQPEPRELWESPIALPLPDDLMFTPMQGRGGIR